MFENHPNLPSAGPEPRIGGPVRDLEEEEELQLAITIMKLNQRLHGGLRIRGR